MTIQTESINPANQPAKSDNWAAAPYVVDTYKTLRIKQDHGFDPLLLDRSQTALRLGMTAENFERHLGCKSAPKAIDPDNLVFHAEDIENFAIRLYGTANGRPVPTKRKASAPPPFMSKDFFMVCDQVQAGAESHSWPDNAVMVTVSLVSPKVKNVAGFNSVMLDGPTKTHVNVLFDMLQEQKHGRYPYRKRKITSPAIVMPERISRKEVGKPRNLVSLHYHAVIGFDSHDEAAEFKQTKGPKIRSKIQFGLKNGLPSNDGTPPGVVLFPDIDTDITVFDPGQGAKAFSYVCKYAYDLLGYSRVCTPENASKA